MPAGTTDISSLQIVQTSPGAHSASYSLVTLVTLVLFRGQSSRGVMLSSHIHLAPTLRMLGAINLLLLYTCLLTPMEQSPY